MNFRTKYNNQDSILIDGGVINSSQTNIFYLTLRKTPSFVFQIEKIVTPAILRQDLNNYYNLNYLGTNTFYTHLSNLLTGFEQRLAAQDSVTARQYLIAFRQKIEAEINDTTNITPEFIDGEAWAILDYDAQYLLTRLPIWKPKNLQASFITSQTVSASWTGEYSTTMLPNGGGYDLYRAIYYDGGALSFTNVNTSLLTTASFSDNPVIPATIPVNKNVYLRYYVVAKNNLGVYSIASDTVQLFVGKTVSGTIVTSTLWNENKIVVASVTVNSGATLTISPGIIIRFTDTTSLIANGKLLALGTTTSKITFTSAGGMTPGKWGSIKLNGIGAHQSKISNAIIKYGTEVKITNISPPSYYFTIDSVSFDTTINAVSVVGSNGWIMNSKINNPSSYGIIAEMGSRVSCYHNTFTKGNYYGTAILYMSDSYDYIWHNTIQGFSEGFGIRWGGSMYGGHPQNNGNNNTIINCQYGIYAYQSGFGMFGNYGDGDDGYDPYYTGNTIDNNSIYDITSATNSTVYAYGVNWGNSGPTYYIYNNSYFYYGGFAKSQANEFLPWNNLKVGEKMRREGKYQEAVQYFSSLVLKNPREPFAYLELYKAYNDTTADNILNVFGSLSKDAPPTAKFVRATLLLRIGEIESAKQVNNELITDYPESYISTRAKLNNLNIALYDENDPDKARKILNDVLRKPELTTEVELDIAQNALKNFVPVEAQDRSQLRKQIANFNNGTPTEFSLSQNYPNPFNPVTTISYSIIEPSNVKLTVYDYLGREVETLINEFKEIGIYTVNFNASELASGIYFYQIRAGKYGAVKKMVVLK